MASLLVEKLTGAGATAEQVAVAKRVEAGNGKA